MSAALMGHSSITVTAEIYAQLFDSELDQVSDALDALKEGVAEPAHAQKCPRSPILGWIGPRDRGRNPSLACGDAVEPPIGIEPDDLFITRELPARKALTWPASAASTKAIQRGQHDRTTIVYVQNALTPTLFGVSTDAVQSRWRDGGAGTDGSGVRLVGEPLPGCLPGDSQGDRDLVP